MSIKLLNSFLKKYREMDLGIMEDEEFARATHALKGLSASIGATELHKAVTELNKTQNRDLLPDFTMVLKRVIDELTEKLVINDIDVSDDKRAVASISEKRIKIS